MVHGHVAAPEGKVLLCDVGQEWVQEVIAVGGEYYLLVFFRGLPHQYSHEGRLGRGIEVYLRLFDGYDRAPRGVRQCGQHVDQLVRAGTLVHDRDGRACPDKVECQCGALALGRGNVSGGYSLEAHFPHHEGYLFLHVGVGADVADQRCRSPCSVRRQGAFGVHLGKCVGRHDPRKGHGPQPLQQ